jgi:hypothetical protein
MTRFGAMVLMIVCALGLAVSAVGAQEGGDELIQNGDFEQGLDFWTVEQPCASCWMEVQSDDAPGGNVLAWERTNSGGEGSAIFAHQSLDVEASGYERLVLTLEVRVESHSLPNSGWWSDQQRGSGEYPAKITLSFTDAAGQPFEWSRGFLIMHDGGTVLQNYALVPPGQWVPLEADLLSPAQWVDARGNPLPRPSRLTAVTVGGNGWDFRAAFRHLSLMGEPAQGGETGGGTVPGLTVEEYPIVSATEDTPNHFEFKQRIGEDILAVRWAWREPDPAASLAAINPVIGAWGYQLEAGTGQGGGPVFTLLHQGSPLLTDLTYLSPLAANASGTDFRLVVDSIAQGTLIVMPGTVGKVDTAHYLGIPPVYVGDDLFEVYGDWDRGQFLVQRNGATIYTVTPSGPYVEPPVHSLWSWDGHWVLESEGDVIIDGQSLKQQLGAQEVFGWRLIAGQPFYFFKQADQIAMSYAGQVVEPYRYSEVVHYMCCEPAMFNVGGNTTMVWFYALRDGTWYYVEAGVYG